MVVRRVGRPGLVGTMARTAVVAGTAQAVTGRVAANQRAKAQPVPVQQAPSSPAAGPAPGPGPDPDDLTTKLEGLASLHTRGMLTDDEFAAAKRKLLSA